MATVNLGRIKPVFRGAYSGSTAYVVDDIVTHGNESFICIQAHRAGTQATSQTAYWTKLAAKGADGTDVGTTLTTQGDILYRDGSGLQRLAKPASDKFLQNTSGGVLSWETVSSDCVKISTVNAAGAADIYMDNVFTDTYKYYRLVYGNVKTLPTNENSDLNPVSPYGLHKVIGEQYCQLFEKIYDRKRYYNSIGYSCRFRGYFCN